MRVLCRHQAATLARLAGVFLALAVTAQVLEMAAVWAATTTAWRTTNSIRVMLARHVLGLDHEFHRTHTPGELIQRVDGDVTSVSDFLGQVVPKAVGAAFLTIGTLTVLTVLDWRLAAGGLLYVVATVWMVRRGRHRAVAESEEEMSAMARLYGGIEERLTAAEDLRANGAAHHAMWRFQTESAGALRAAVRREQAFMRLWWRVQGVVGAGTIIALLTGAFLVPNGTITLGTAFLLLQYVTLLERPLHDVIHQLEVVQKANGAMVRVVDLMAVPAAPENSPAHMPLCRWMPSGSSAAVWTPSPERPNSQTKAGFPKFLSRSRAVSAMDTSMLATWR